jgi:hypothetical protein
LKQSSDDHDDDSDSDGFLAAEFLSEERGCDAAEETSHLVDGHNQTSDGWTGLVECLRESFGIDKPILCQRGPFDVEFEVLPSHQTIVVSDQKEAETRQ